MDQNGPVTVVVRHRVKKGREAAFEDWLRGISQAVLRFEGQQGYHVIRPTDAAMPEYVVMLRFDALANLEKWETSAVRREWLDRLEPLEYGAPVRERHTGMEVWFNPPGGRPAAPRYKMLVVTILTVYPIITTLQLTLLPLIEDWPMPVRTLVTASIMVTTMTYVAMPFSTWLFSRWLYG